MQRHTSLVVDSSCSWIFVGLLLLLPVPATAEPPKTKTVQLDIAARVVRVAKSQVVIERGSDDGLTKGAVVTFNPVRTGAGAFSDSVDVTMVLGRGHVSIIGRTRSVVKVDISVDTIAVGDVGNYTIDVPSVLIDEPMFILASNATTIKTLEEKTPFFTLSSLMTESYGAKGEATRAAAITDMVAEVHAHAELAKTVMKKPITAGRYHGQTMHEAFAATTAEDIRELIEFMREYPGKYYAKDWVLVNVYATWLINASPTGTDSRRTRQQSAAFRAAKSKVRDGKFEIAEKGLREILRAWAGHDGAKKLLEQIRKIELLGRQLRRDPGNTSLRWQRARELYRLSVYDLCIRELARLEAAKYRPRRIAHYRGYIASAQGRHDEAIAIFERLAREKETENLRGWIRASKARKQLAKGSETDSYEGYMELARIHAMEESYPSAQNQYRKAVSVAKTAAQFAEIRDGQKRVKMFTLFDKTKRGALERIDEHAPELALERVETLIVLGSELGIGKRLDKALDDIGEHALRIFEEQLGLEINRRRLDLITDNVEALKDIAWLHYVRTEFEDAHRVALKAVKLAPSDEFAYHVAAKSLVGQGKLREAEKLNVKASEDPKYGWPRHSLAVIAASRGHWTRAVELVNTAYLLLPDQASIHIAKSVIEQAADAEKRLTDGGNHDRCRLTQVRALVVLDQWRPARAMIATMAAGPHRIAANAALAENTSRHIPAAVKLAAARKLPKPTAWMDARVRRLEAEVAFESKPSAQTATALAAAFNADGTYHRAWLTAARYVDDRNAADRVEDAKAGLVADAKYAEAVARLEDGEGAQARAVKLLRSAEKTWNRIGNVSDATLAVFMQAGPLGTMGKKEEAQKLLESLLPKVTSVGSFTDVLNVEQALADMRFARGMLSARLENARHALERCEDRNSDYCAAHNAIQLSNFLTADGQLKAGLVEAQKGHAYAERLGQPQLLRRSVFTLAEIRYSSFEHTEARRLGNKLLAMSQKASDGHYEKLALTVLGAVAMRTGDAEKAIDYFMRAYRLGQRTGDNWGRATAQRFVGHTWLHVGKDPKKAAVAFSSALAIYKNLRVELSVIQMEAALGVAWTELGRLDEARKVFKRAYDVAKKRQRTVLVATTRTELASLELKANRPAEALTAAKEAAAVAATIELPRIRWSAWHVLGKAHEKSGDLDEALKSYELAVDEVARLQPRGGEDGFLSFGRTRDVYKDAIDLMLRMGKVDRAFEILELSRDANLKRMFNPAKVKTGSAKVDQTLDKLGSAESAAEAARREMNKEQLKPAAEQNPDRLKALGERVAESDGNVKRLLLRLKARHRGLYSAFAVDPRSLLSDRDLLPDDAVVLAYFAAGDSLFIFVIAKQNQDARAVKINLKGEDLAKVVARYRRSLERGSESAETISRQLYRWLLEPVLEDIKGARTVLVMPSGPLYYLPFHALITNAEGEDPEYAIEKIRLAYVSSTTVQELRRPPRRTKVTSLAAFANPDGTLPGAVDEVAAMTKVAFPKADVLVGAAAVKEAVFSKAGKFHIMHFATHGVLDPDPLKSHLTMASGKLTVDDIAGIDFQDTTDLIVLSACRTALAVGDQMGEGISIAEAFATAGAPSLVASLWDVDDEATSKLMSAFYGQLSKQDEKTDLLEALRTAQLELIRYERDGENPFAEPVYWAAFELIGDYR
ncbi:MAG: CHAT domain-containing protein [Myxococcota bacterium]|jgi:CHAT domain-containing protein